MHVYACYTECGMFSNEQNCSLSVLYVDPVAVWMVLPPDLFTYAVPDVLKRERTGFMGKCGCPLLKAL